MNEKNPTLRQLGFISFLAAIVLGILLIAARAWPDMESTFYGFVKYDYPAIPSLKCPVLMTSLDQQAVTIRLHNQLERDLKWYINTQLSTSVVMSTSEQTVQLAPGETRTISWEVDKDNIDLSDFIFANVFISPAAAMKMQSSTCGTLVLNLPLSGGPVIFYSAVAIYGVILALGLWVWSRHSEMSNPGTISMAWWMRFVGLIITIGIVEGILDWWFLGILSLVLTMLSLGVFLFPHKD